MGLEDDLRKRYGLPNKSAGIERRAELYSKEQRQMTNPVKGPTLREVRQRQIDEQKKAAQAPTDTTIE